MDAYIKLGKTVPAIKPWLPALISAMKMTEDGTKWDNKDLLLEGIADGTKYTKIITPLLKPVPAAYNLALKTPAIAKEFSDELIRGAKKPADFNNVVGYFLKSVKGGECSYTCHSC